MQFNVTVILFLQVVTIGSYWFSIFYQYNGEFDVKNCEDSKSHVGTFNTAHTKTNLAAIKLFETKKENKFQQTKRGLR